MESWAEGVETIVTNDKYLTLDGSYQSTQQGDFNGRWNFGRQRNTVNQMTKYTPIVDDLIDNLNQNATVGNTRPIDKVRGYRLNQIQRAFNN